MRPDYIIKNGTIVNGKNEAPFKGDLAVKDGKIIGPELCIVVPDDFPDERVIRADGAYVTPGFVDIHRHGDLLALRGGDDELLNRQGITTCVNGCCGLSAAPAGNVFQRDIFAFLSSVIGENPFPKSNTFSSMAAYLTALSGTPRSVNTGMLVGNGTVRAAVCGYFAAELTEEQISCIQQLLIASLEAGALGISLGLAYAPEFSYTRKSLTEVLRPLAGSGIPLIAHIRNEGDGLAASVREMIGTAEDLKLPLHISHMKCIGRRNWHTEPRRVRALVDEARLRGLVIDYDLYPYTTGSTQLVHLLPPEFQNGGTAAIIERLRNPTTRSEITEVLKKPSRSYENIVELVGFDRIYVPSLRSRTYSPYCGASIASIGEKLGIDPYEVLYDILIEEKCAAPMLDTYGSEEDMDFYYRSPLSSVISDSIYPAAGKLHPRVYAAFPKFLKEYVCEKKMFPIEEAIYKMTAGPAGVLGIERGTIEEGGPADLCIFRLEDLRAEADFSVPDRLCSGFSMVMTNGKPCVINDRWVNSGSGEVLKKKSRLTDSGACR